MHDIGLHSVTRLAQEHSAWRHFKEMTYVPVRTCQLVMTTTTEYEHYKKALLCMQFIVMKPRWPGVDAAREELYEVWGDVARWVLRRFWLTIRVGLKARS